MHGLGLKVVHHLCAGVMGGDWDLREASRRAGKKLFFIGGFDQNAGFERGTPEVARRQVFECFEATKEHAGYIACSSDHFFFGSPMLAGVR
jgi:hypothetical protein